MKNKNWWINLSLFNLTIVAFAGMILRSKILFSLPAIDYDHLLHAHEHFAFGGWVTLALMLLFVDQLLPSAQSSKPIYQWLLGGIALSSWCTLFTYYVQGNGDVSNLISTVFIFITYVFGWVFISDMRKTGLSKTVLLLSIAAVVCLVISSIGPFALAYLFASKSLSIILYRDFLYTYLHFLYNGFFTLTVLALLFHHTETKMTNAAKKNMHRFSVLLCCSLVPSLFLSFLWHNPSTVFWILAVTGSLLLLMCFYFFLNVLVSFKNVFKEIVPVIKYMGLLSMIAFLLKIFLQSFTVFPVIGHAVFGDRPMIIGFLHLVFLGLVTLFILAGYAQKEWLNSKSKFTYTALVIFTCGVVLNELVLMTEGLGSMFFKSNYLFPWLLWGVSILLFTGALLIAISRIKNKKLQTTEE